MQSTSPSHRLNVANALKWVVEHAGPRVHMFAEIVEITSYGFIVCGLVVPDHHYKMSAALLFLVNTWLHSRLKHNASDPGQQGTCHS